MWSSSWIWTEFARQLFTFMKRLTKTLSMIRLPVNTFPIRSMRETNLVIGGRLMHWSILIVFVFVVVCWFVLVCLFLCLFIFLIVYLFFIFYLFLFFIFIFCWEWKVMRLMILMNQNIRSLELCRTVIYTKDRWPVAVLNSG